MGVAWPLETDQPSREAVLHGRPARAVWSSVGTQGGDFGWEPRKGGSGVRMGSAGSSATSEAAYVHPHGNRVEKHVQCSGRWGPRDFGMARQNAGALPQSGFPNLASLTGQQRKITCAKGKTGSIIDHVFCNSLMLATFASFEVASNTGLADRNPLICTFSNHCLSQLVLRNRFYGELPDGDPWPTHRINFRAAICFTHALIFE